MKLVNPAKDDRLEYARQIIQGEATALMRVAEMLDGSFLQTVELISRCPGRVCITGTGKSADVGQKIAGTLNSTGTRAYVLDATRAVHGDLGMVHHHDIVIALSYSGETEEVLKLLPSFRQMALALVAITGHEESTLAKASDIALILGQLEEVCPLGLAPSTSTTAMIAVGDALAFSLMRMREFTHEDFARFHPAGSLGRKLLKVESIMRQGNELRISDDRRSIREVFSQERRLGRRTGAVMLTDESGVLSGIFTDSDLARLFEKHRDASFDRPIREVMTPRPITVPIGTRLTDAVELIRRRKISELPVVDGEGRPAGMIDITDLIGLVSREEAESCLRAAG